MTRRGVNVGRGADTGRARGEVRSRAGVGAEICHFLVDELGFRHIGRGNLTTVVYTIGNHVSSYVSTDMARQTYPLLFQESEVTMAIEALRLRARTADSAQLHEVACPRGAGRAGGDSCSERLRGEQIG